MTRSRAALLLAVLTAAGAALAYSLLAGSPSPRTTSPSLRPLIAKASFEACVGELASRDGAKGVLPELHLPCLDGSGSRDLLWSGTRTQLPTVVNVYGSWCGPCATEMPVLRRLHEAAGPRIRLVGIDTEDEPRSALLFAIDLRQHWPALRDDDGLVSRALGGGAPKTVFVSTSGQVVHVQRGAYTSYEQLLGDMKRYLGLSL